MMQLVGTSKIILTEEGSKMECRKNDMSVSFQTMESGMISDDSRQPVHRRPAGLTIRVREMECALADIQAEIQSLRRERTYLRLVREELAGKEPREMVLHPAPPRRNSRLSVGSLGVHKPGGPRW